ncbi:MAG: mevalonate kinase [Euryarchaeota archaeon]|jgi:mevalonate kinase|nr:mevalonate kinase [Euryarchaeota archaeon]MBF14409.1 mevalonate kinase [Euryarchaeota archaeon]CAI8281893.1 MAG: Galactokinase [Euryarchaeota archaeon UBA443]
MVKTSAPGKCILFGEHAVVYGQPALACSINQRMTVEIEKEETFDSWRLDGRTFKPKKHPHIEYIRKHLPPLDDQPLHIRIRGTIPKASGLGSSAALSVALCGALQQIREESIDLLQVSSISHHAEAEAQGGRASPMDTATSSFGGFVVLSDTIEENLDFIETRTMEVNGQTRQWHLHTFDANIPEGVSLVVGNTGVHGSTSAMVNQVANLIRENPERKIELETIGAIARRGIQSLQEGDMEAVGQAMSENHMVLRSLGVSSPEIERLIRAAAPSSLGVKLTGAGGGGCMIALTRNPEQTVGAIEMEGGRAFITHFNEEGLRIEHII